jgi:hypothetical protein
MHDALVYPLFTSAKQAGGGKLKSKAWSSCTLVVFLLSFAMSVTNVAFCQGIRPVSGEVEVQRKVLLRDGHMWVPHGFYQIAFEVAPGNLERADHPFWATAYNYYTPQEYDDMRSAGADSVRLQISQIGADPQSPLFSKEFLEKALSAIAAARAAGLTVIVCVQDESHVPGDKAIDLPDEGTRRVWKEIAPRFANDAQVAYASHPYALQQYGQTRKAWDGKFGNFSRRAPVIITEWLSGGYFCDPDTATSTVQFLQYLQERGIGLEAGAWDWAPGGFGSARWNFPNGRFSTYIDRECHQPGYGMGRTVETWYTTGVPATAPQ